MDASTITTNTFEDGGTSGAAINSVTMASPPLSCTVVATPTTAGNLILQVKAGAVVKDLFGNPLDTDLAIQDDIVISVVAATAQNGTWTADQDGDWGDSPNWQSSNVAYGADSIATFPNSITANRTVTLDRDITIGNIDFQETGQDLTLSGAQTLTLEVTSGMPEISVTNRTLNITSIVAGTNGLSKSGNGTLSLSGANTFTGDITTGGGTLTFSNLGAWGGSGKNVTFTDSATLGGADGYTAGQVAVSNGVTASIVNSLTITSATGSGALDQKASGKTLSILDGTTFTGALLVTCTYSPNSTLQFQSLTDAAGAGNLKFGGGSSDGSRVGTMRLYGDVAPLVLNHRQIEVTPKTANHGFRDIELKNDNATSTNRWVINTDLINNESYRGKVLVLRGTNTGDNEFAGTIPDGANMTLITKLDAGRWILSGENTYSGMTTVSGGTLVLKGEASIADSNTVNIISGTLEIETREAIRELQFGGTTQNEGIWGAVGNGMATYTDSRLTGPGLLFVNEPFPPSGTVLILR